VIELYQAEWCPHSHVVRQRLTELDLDFVAHQVAPRQEDREAMRAMVATDSIPTLVDGDMVVSGEDEIVAFLDERFEEPGGARGHRAQARAHAA
jgi:glutathione S-transferase